MNETRLIKLLELFYTSTYVPNCLIKDESILKINSNIEDATFIFNDLINLVDTYNYYPNIYENDGIGNFSIFKHNDYYIIIGPFNEKQNYFNVIQNISSDTRLYLKEIPIYSYQKFINTILFFEYLINNNEVSFSKFYNTQINEMSDIKKIETKIIDNDIKKHNTYYLEQMILSYIKEGNSVGLIAFLKEYIKYQPDIIFDNIKDDLRKEKNTSIGYVHEIIKFAAIPGGLDIDRAYTLMDIYINKIEKCTTISDVLQLRYDISIDLSNRVKDEINNTQYSMNVDYAIQFIKNNTNKNIGVMDVVNNVNKSRAYLLKKFKEETGYSIGEYIMKMKLKDSCMALKYSNYTIAEVSYQFGFSSQSYFQNKFKKEFGMTPKTFRTNQ